MAKFHQFHLIITILEGSKNTVEGVLKDIKACDDVIIEVRDLNGEVVHLSHGRRKGRKG